MCKHMYTNMVFHIVNVFAVFVLADFAFAGTKLFGLEGLKLKFEFDKGDDVFDITAEGEYLVNASVPALHNTRQKRVVNTFRPGQSTTTNTCDHVRDIPEELRDAAIMRPDGLSDFYQKYTETYGIPILGSTQVSDDALKRACYTVRFMLADHAAIRESYYKLSGRVAIMAATEVTKDIPEHSNMEDYMNSRARGLGATIVTPVSTGAEENVLCLPHDPYHGEDIFLHEFAHAVDGLGATIVIPDWHQQKLQVYNNAKSTGLWANTYAIKNAAEYFAEGVQSFFNANAHAIPTNGIHNDIDTHEELRTYDPQLFDLIQSLFPCNNHYLKRCESNRTLEQRQDLKMDCNTDSAVFPETPLPSSTCQDNRVECLSWAATGECDGNPAFMHTVCKASCHICTTEEPAVDHGNAQVHAECTDSSSTCADLASRGDCWPNAAYMLVNCKYSCNNCDDVDGCKDENTNCAWWTNSGECTANPAYMLTYCKKSCQTCGYPDAEVVEHGHSQDVHGHSQEAHGHAPVHDQGHDQCVDENSNCPWWASVGECEANPAYMLADCKLSCNGCASAELLECTTYLVPRSMVYSSR